MNSKLKKILFDLSEELGISTKYLEKLVNAGSSMIFQEDLENLDNRFKMMSVPDDLFAETLLYCAYGEVLRRLADVTQ